MGGGRGRNWQTSGTTTSRFARRISSSTGRVKMGIGRWGEASRLQEVGSGLTLRKYAGCARGSPTCPSARHSLRRLHYADLVGSAASRLRLRKSTMWCRRMWRLINFGIRKIGSPYAQSATGRNPPLRAAETNRQRGRRGEKGWRHYAPKPFCRISSQPRAATQAKVGAAISPSAGGGDILPTNYTDSPKPFCLQKDTLTPKQTSVSARHREP